MPPEASAPPRVIELVLERIESHPRDNVWISRFPEMSLRARARALDALPRQGRPDRLPLTAACPDFAYAAKKSATAVARLEAVGAIVIGKTNLDQFATGLVGTRSLYSV
jgi:allophanate hydrolase